METGFVPRVATCLCTSAQTVACRSAKIVIRREKPSYREHHMLFIVGVVILLVTVMIIPRMRMPDGMNAANLGWMSERWLVEHRASHSR